MFFDSPGSGKGKKEHASMGQRILGFCFALLLGVILLTVALELLAAIWGWLLLLALAVLAVTLGVKYWRWRRDQW